MLMLVAGDHPLTAVYAGNGNSASSTSTVLHEMVQGTLATTTTTLTVTANPAVAGQSVTLTAKVTAAGGITPTGTVTFAEGSRVLGSSVLKTGVSMWTTSAFAAGNHTLVARYEGDGLTAASSSTALNEVVQAQAGQEPPPGLTLGIGTITVAAGHTVSIPVVLSVGAAGMEKALSLSCTGLPEEATCTFAPGSSGAATSTGTSTLRIATSAPRDRGSSTPYGVPEKSAVLPVAGLLLVLAGRRRTVKGSLALVCAAVMICGMTGCATGNCTDLGTRPETYTITIVGSAGGAQVSQKVKLVVTP